MLKTPHGSTSLSPPATDGRPHHYTDPTPRASGRTGDRPPRLPALDGLRFLAALSVAVFHLVAGGESGLQNLWGAPASDVFGTGWVIASYGWVGVPLFFMISGFVICMTSWNRTQAEYTVSRIVRLYPAFWACVLLTTLVTTLHPDLYHPAGWRTLLANLTMLQDPLGEARIDGVYWTLWLELKFYLLFLIVLWRGTSYRNVVGFCLAWTIASVLAGGLHQPWLDALLIRGNSQYFIAGIALYLIHRYGSRPVLWVIVGLSWIQSMHYYAANPWQEVHGRSYLPSSILITASFAVLTLLALGKLDRLRWRGLTVLGTAAYPLYLLHNVAGSTAIHALRQHLNVPPVALLTVALLALTGFALLVHRLVELPLAPRMKAWLTGRTPRRPMDLVRSQDPDAQNFRGVGGGRVAGHDDDHGPMEHRDVVLWQASIVADGAPATIEPFST